ncbi:MAG: 4Fe-4S dicluster-binding protein [Acidobacteriota bacterium]
MGSYIITSECIGCAECLTVCEDEAIEERGNIYTINSACTDCAACEAVCPVQCIVKIYNAK